ncbi:MAG: D-alanyl-D-alanine carboxypeptidase [Ruminococcaceae bacterium]|nr:D-alanyl-D-alanine carboxypeptidase [Oscillospiraceae bacterium]
MLNRLRNSLKKKTVIKLCFFAIVVISFVLPVCASDDVKAMPELTYNGKTLSEYAGMDNRPQIEGFSAYAMNLNTGTVIYEKNSKEPVFPASTVKLMTAIVAYENIPDLDVDITASAEAVRKTQGANILIAAGEVYSANELLNALLISGANDAALVLAEYVAGSEEEFVKLMNDKAKQIGANSTTFANVTGFDDPDQLTTARDTAIIGQYFYYVSELFNMSNSTRFESDRIKRILTNRNMFLSKVTSDKYFYNPADGMSVGSTPDGGYCGVSTVTADNGLTYLCVVMKSIETDDTSYVYRDLRSIFDFCTDNFGYQVVASTDSVMCELAVKNAVDVDHFALFPETELKVLLPNDLDFAKDITFEKRVFTDAAKAPVNKGSVFGEVVVKYKGEVAIGKINLVSDVSVDKSNVLYFLSKVERFVKSKWFIVFTVTLVVLFLVYIGFSIYYKYFRRSKYTGNRLKDNDNFKKKS